MIKKEQQFTTKWLKWHEYNKHLLPDNFTAEIKVPRGKTFYWNNFPEHQNLALHLTESKEGVRWKLSDADRTTKPFDLFCMRNAKGFLILYWIRRANKTFYMIDINIITREMKKDKIGISEEIANRICSIKGEII